MNYLSPEPAQGDVESLPPLYQLICFKHVDCSLLKTMPFRALSQALSFFPEVRFLDSKLCASAST